MLENTNKQKKGVGMRSYPIWIDTHNPSYKGSKSQGVRNYAINDVAIGTSATNSYHFLTNSVSVEDNGNKRTFNFFVDNELMKSATYNRNKKTFESENLSLELQLKKKYFDRWKKQEQDAEQKFRNERYSERLRVNGGYNVK